MLYRSGDGSTFLYYHEKYGWLAWREQYRCWGKNVVLETTGPEYGKFFKAATEKEFQSETGNRLARTLKFSERA